MKKMIFKHALTLNENICGEALCLYNPAFVENM